MKKRKIMSIMALSLVIAMGAVSLTGCGTQAKATDITVDDGDTIIVDEEDLETESESDADEVTSTEVIGGDETASDFAGAEDENIVLYAETAEYGEYFELYKFDYTTQTSSVVTTEDVPLYNGDGIEVGYIKAGSDVSITENATNGYWTRFENPIDGTDYDYLYVFKNNVPELDPKYKGDLSSMAEVSQLIIDELNMYPFTSTILDAATSDMESCEFRVSRYGNDVRSDVAVAIQERPVAPFSHYQTFAVECEEDGDYAICKVYYKDEAEIPEDVQ